MDPNVTPHQLELFYQVARHGGISAAARHMPYGLGQPAISGQMTEFESELGVKLFERRPFGLNDHGRIVYDYIGPFFDGLPALWQQLRGGPANVVRIAAGGMIGEEFLPAVIAATVTRPADTCFDLLTGPSSGMEAWLFERRAHLVVTTADRIRGARSDLLAQPKLCLFVPTAAKIDSPGHFWRQGRIAEPLICPLEAGGALRVFERGLRALGVEWTVVIRVDSTAIMLQLVAAGCGVGVGLELPAPTRHPEVRGIPLKNFDRVQLRALWRRPVEALIAPVLSAAKVTAGRFWPPATLSLAALLVGRWFVLADEFI